MSVLSIIQDVALDLTLPSPSAVVTSTDGQVQQMFNLLKRDVKDLLRRYDWQNLIVETSFPTVATQVQTAIPSDFYRMVDETMNNRTQHWRVLGPLSPQEWQRRLGLGVQTGVVNSFRIYDNSIYFYPIPIAGDSIYYEYITNKFALAADGVTTKSAFTADADTVRLDEDLVTLGVKWRFLRAKGLDYAEEFRTYESALEAIFGSDGARGPVDMTGSTVDWTIPSIPDGSWNI